jgi:voltage-gated potassium channel
MMIVRQIINKMIKLNNWFLFFVTITFILLSTLIIHQIEPETFTTNFEAFWWVMTTVTTVGYGDLYPITSFGRSFAMILYIFGIGLLGLVIGKVVDAFATFKRLKEEGKLNYSGSDHIVIFGWSNKAYSAVVEILASEDEIEVVIIDQLAKEPFSHDRVHYIQGDPSVEDVLLQANVRSAKAAIIFADDKIHDPVLGDGKSLLFVSAVENHAPDVYTVVEILREEHIRNFVHVKVDEFVLAHEMISRLLVRSTLQNGITDFFTQLLSRSIGDDIYEIDKREQWVTYRDAVEDLMKQGATLIGEGKNINVHHMLDKPLPKNVKLNVICNKATFENLKR